jgi:hypothetical protein
VWKPIEWGQLLPVVDIERDKHQGEELQVQIAEAIYRVPAAPVRVRVR